jgi:2-polyprenyl-3-methyl-5-hydroxy-6-metoxy-1,4-benzoquinol methylase
MNRCLACGGSAASTVFESHGFEIRRCHHCGHGRTVLDETFDPSTYYSESYFQGGVVDGYSDYQGSSEALRLEFRRIVRDILPFSRRGRLLEFGCAYGFFLDEAAPHFAHVHGIEYSEAAARACRDRKLDVRTGPVAEELLDGLYDTVVGLDVIEHVEDPHDTLKVLADHMPRAGVLVLTTGDWGSPMARLMGRRWRLMTPPQHLSFFTAKSLTTLLARIGLDVVSLSYPWKRVPLSLIAYQLQRMLGVTPHQIPALNRLALPINLWDAMRVIARKH